MKIFFCIAVLIFVLVTSCQDKKSKNEIIDGKQTPIINSKQSKIDIIGLENAIEGQEFVPISFKKQPN